MNPKLIKHDVDDEEYSNAAPAIATLLAAHYSTPEKHRDDLYSADTEFFSWYPDRRIYLRPAFPLEWDIDEESSRPTLWCRVHRIFTGFHEILPVWRGPAFWRGSDCDSDSAVGILCYAFAMREGINLAEWMGYVQDQRIRKANTSKRKSKPGRTVIH